MIGPPQDLHPGATGGDVRNGRSPSLDAASPVRAARRLADPSLPTLTEFRPARPAPDPRPAGVTGETARPARRNATHQP